jgi:hypothetical protein
MRAIEVIFYSTLAVFLVAFTLPQLAHANACLDAKAVSEIKQELKIELNDSKGSICAKDSKTYKLMETLVFLKNIRFKTNKKIDAKINQGLLAKGFWTYLKEQNLQAIRESNDPICAQNKIYGYVDQVKNPNVISLCSHFFDSSVSTPDRAQLILHESRHFTGHPHVSCVSGPWKGIEGGCDESINAKGSYAVSAESMARVGVLAKNLSRAARANAKLLSLGYAQNRFNKPVFANGARAVYLTSESQEKAYIFDGKAFYPAPYVEEAAVISRLSDVHVFPKDHDKDAYVLQLYSSTGKSDKQVPKNALTLQYNGLHAAERPDLLDVVNAGEFLCFVQSLIIDCSNAKGKRVSVPPTSVISRVYAPDEMAMTTPKNSLLLVNGADRIQRLTINSDGTHQLVDTEMKIQGFKAIVKFPGGRLALRTDGTFVREKGSSWVPVPNTKGVQFDSLSRSFFWSPNFIESSRSGQ